MLEMEGWGLMVIMDGGQHGRPAEKCGPTIIHSAPSKQASGKSLLLISRCLIRRFTTTI
jgi:hypothetical protein